jgi:hypothetical protein
MNGIIQKTVQYHVSYFIDEENRVVVAKIKRPGSAIHQAVNQTIQARSQGPCLRCSDFLPNGSDWFDRFDKIQLISMAKCHENDAWNPSEGKKIAYRRLCGQLKCQVDPVLQKVVREMAHISQYLELCVHGPV